VLQGKQAKEDSPRRLHIHPHPYIPITPNKQTDRPELFHSLGGSHGALGLVALAGVECEPAGEYVRLAYSRQRTVEEGAEGLRRACGYYEGDGKLR
jgi:hypothetical protein